MCRRTRIWAKLMERTTILPCGCHRWDGPDSGEGRGGGYGRVCIDGGTMATHIVGWVIEHGPIPPRKQLDHTCTCCNTGRRCWNPALLEPGAPGAGDPQKEPASARCAAQTERGRVDVPVQ